MSKHWKSFNLFAIQTYKRVLDYDKIVAFVWAKVVCLDEPQLSIFYQKKVSFPRAYK